MSFAAWEFKEEARKVVPFKVRARAWKFGDNINTESILPTEILHGRYPLDVVKRNMFAAYDPEFGPNFKENDIIVAGGNMGCSSSRYASGYLKRFGISVIIAESVSQIFYRNSVCAGLPVLVCPGITKKVNKGDELEVNIETGEIRNLTTGEVIKANPPRKEILEIIKAGNLFWYLREKGKI